MNTEQKTTDHSGYFDMPEATLAAMEAKQNAAQGATRSTAPFRVIESAVRGYRFMVVDERGDAELGNWFIASTWCREDAEFIADCFAAKLEARHAE